MARIKKILKFAGIVVVGVIILLAALWYGLSWFGEWKFAKDIKQIQEETNRPYLEDTYGGKTPQETLQLFVAAVEKGDFDLASKYFVLSKQGEWKRKLIGARAANKLETLLKPVKEENEKLKNEEPLWEGKNNFVSGDAVLFQFVKYPKVWKIKEI